ncbi:hypothetical protein PMZ80_010854 [Knufia obscura]|uniref:RAVE subunit 2/Rogdi n=1 Tax=Knufia obscura TaxID=1635080 RepID=A0ABR0R8F8_9EURO|nr:hypothetical protein PMZ80_010854 [Knufia obscura]
MWVHPRISPQALRKAEDESLQRELQWYLNSLQSSLAALKEGLEECVKLLAPVEPGSTLVLSSLRSESVKGFVTRVGTKITKGDIQLRLLTVPPNTTKTAANSTPSTRLSFKPSPQTPEIVLPQLLSVRSLINDALDIIDISRWTGSSIDASFIWGQLKLLHDRLTEAKTCLKGHGSGVAPLDVPGIDWTKDSVPDEVFDPRLPNSLSLHFSIQDANLVLTIRSIVPASPGGTPNTPSESAFSLSGLHLRNRLLGISPRLPNHDESGEVFEWKGKEDVIVREKARVETGDPSLMSVAAKLSALEHEVARWRFNLNILMGKGDDDD